MSVSRAPTDAVATFRTLTRGSEKLVVHADFEAAVRKLGLPDRQAVAALFASAPAESGRSSTAIAALPGRPERLRLRPVLHGGLLGPLWGRRLLALARPIAELHATETLLRRGAPVPQPVLVAGWRASPLWTGVLGTVQVEQALDGVAFLATPPSAASLRGAAAAAGQAVRRFHEAGGRHADLHLKNLLFCETGDDRIECLVIDLDKVRVGDPPAPRRRMQELMRLYRSLLKRGAFEQVGEQGREAFFSAYTETDAKLESAMLEHWPRELRRVRRHAAGYAKSRLF